MFANFTPIQGYVNFKQRSVNVGLINGFQYKVG